MSIAERCADDGFGFYVVLQLPNVSALPKIAGPFITRASAWRAMDWIEAAFPAVRWRLTVAVKVGSDPEDYPTVRDPALPSGQRKIGRDSCPETLPSSAPHARVSAIRKRTPRRQP